MWVGRSPDGESMNEAQAVSRAGEGSVERRC